MKHGLLRLRRAFEHPPCIGSLSQNLRSIRYFTGVHPKHFVGHAGAADGVEEKDKANPSQSHRVRS